ncbi:MAG: hypothetical protein P1U89_08970 [Verrucomicrobiales bacterium]|nr:hypothetical protein [Verrucomicrobiales bacterium]
MKHKHKTHTTLPVVAAFAVGMASIPGASTVSASDGYPPRYQVLSDPSTAKKPPARKKREFKPIAPSRVSLRSETVQTSAMVIEPPIPTEGIIYEPTEPPIPTTKFAPYTPGPRIPAPPIPEAAPVILEEPELPYTSEEVEEPKPVAPAPKPAASTYQPVKRSSTSAQSVSRKSWSLFKNRNRSGDNCRT